MIAERILMGLLLGGVAIGCVLVLYPFLSALLWAGILVFTTWPVYDWLRTQLPNATTKVQNNLRLGAGLVFRF